MTHLATPDAPLVWEAVSAALTAAQADRAREDARTTRELVTLLNVEDATVAGAVAAAGDALAAAIDAIAARLARGGRLVYVGAGTSGRLAALDAAECGPTFGSPPGEVVAIVAGDGEDAEDDAERGDAELARARRRRRRTRSSASARAARRRTRSRRSRPRAARVRSASRSCACATARSAALAEHEVAVVVGPEVVSGSTRLKAGTAQKLVAQRDLDGRR